MKSSTTTPGAVAMGNFSFRTAFILFIILMFIPGCMNNIAKSEIRMPSISIENKVTTSFISIIDGIDKGADAIRYAANGGEDGPSFDETGYKNGKNTDDNASTLPVNNNQGPLNPTGHIMQPEASHQFDPHENGEEDHIMEVDLPLLVRIAIMLMLFLLLV